MIKNFLSIKIPARGAFFVFVNFVQRCRQNRMESDDAETLAVLDAADHWVATIEELIVAKQASEETDAKQEAVDLAETRLALAVKKWRSKRTGMDDSPPG